MDFTVFFSREFTGLYRDFVVFFSREFTGVSVDSTWTLHEFVIFLIESLLDFRWTLHGLCDIFYTEFPGVPVDSIWTLHEFVVFFSREFTGLHIDFVIFNYTEFAGTPNGLKGRLSFHKKKFFEK